MAITSFIVDLEAARRFLEEVPLPSRVRGEEYFRSGAVKRLEVRQEGQQVVASVQGGRLYAVEVSYEDGEWWGECSCPMACDCKHAYAAMRAALVSHSSAPAGKQRRLEDVLPAALGRKLHRDEMDYVSRVVGLFRSYCQTLELPEWQLLPFLPTGAGLGWKPAQLGPCGTLDQVEFWHGMAAAIRQRRGVIPSFMRVLDEAAPPSAELEKWLRKDSIRTWKTTFEEAVVDSQGTPLESVGFRMVLARGAPQFEAKLPDETEFKVLKATPYKYWLEKFRAGALLASADALGLWMGLSRRFDTTMPRSYDDEMRKLLAWLLSARATAGLMTENRQPLQISAEPLKWHVIPDQVDYAVRLLRPDGTPAGDVVVVVPGPENLYVLPDGVYPGPLGSRAGLSDGSRGTIIPKEALETEAGLRFFSEVGAVLPERLAARVERASLRVRVSCSMKVTYGTYEVLAARVCALHGDTVQETLSMQGWRPEATARPQKAAAGVVRVWDRKNLALFPSLLHEFGEKWTVLAGEWQHPIGKTFPERFVGWCRQLPPEVELECGGELRSLLEAPLSAVVNLDCQEESIDWFDVKVVLNVEELELTKQELELLLKAKGNYVRLPEKGWRRLEFQLSPEQDEQLAKLGLSAHELSAEPQRFHALQLADPSARAFLPEQQVERIRRRAEELQTRINPEIPSCIRASLRPYQVSGFHFLAYLSSNRFGGILADDMGLGKTVQTLTWLAWLRQEGEAKPILVVCPKSVMENWRNEAERFYPELRVCVWSAAQGELGPKTLAAVDVVVVNYAQLRGMEEALSRVPWLAAILDEGQYIKNPDSLTARAARRLKAEHRLILSGTPIENRLLDLWSLMAFAMPGVLGNRKHFARLYDRKGDALARLRLTARVRPFLVRRTKKQVATELPDRIEEDFYCTFEPEQKALYQAELKKARQLLLQVQTQGGQMDQFRFNFLASLLRLRQICCHPGLYVPEAERLGSAKLEALFELLEPLIAEGEKVLVFSQFTSMLDIIEPGLKERDWPYFYLSGKTENRGELVSKFQKAEGAAVFLISLKAGGFGLNLTAASYVVLFDPWWNPAVENQAIDRTHRIGQTEKVIAYRLLMKNSIEEKIRVLQKAKGQLAGGILTEEGFGGQLTLSDFAFLFGEEEANASA